MLRVISTTVFAAVMALIPVADTQAGEAKTGVSYQDRKQGKVPFEQRGDAAKQVREHKKPEKIEPAAGNIANGDDGDQKSAAPASGNLAEDMKLPRKH